ncbi:MAG: hypothetical protein VX911_05015 [Candidatus Latescibacterota bacterium]|nr:hypothetical protein [Candidatus Latescibacterota bacterium]
MSLRSTGSVSNKYLHGPVIFSVKLQKAAGLESRTAHEIRHTCASLLIADGVSTVQVAAAPNPSIALRVYAHLFRRDLGPVFLPKVVTAGKAA